MSTAEQRTPVAEDRADTRMFVLLHHAIRTDLRRLVAALDTLREDEPDRVAALVRWYRELARQIHDHHQAEDEVFFPALAARSSELGAGAAPQEQMADDHRYLAALTDRVAGHLERLSDRRHPWADAHRAARADAAALVSLAQDHFEHEERDMVPLFARYFSASEYAVLNRRADRLHRPSDLAFALPWFFDHLSAVDRDAATTETPVLMRVLATILRPRYRRLVRAAGLQSTGVVP